MLVQPHLQHTLAHCITLAHSSASVEVGKLGQLVEPVFAPAVMARDCPALPKLCTHSMMLDGHDTIMTYLCPETTVPSTVTVTTTSTTTVTAELTTSTVTLSTVDKPLVSITNGGSVTSQEPTITMEPTTTVEPTMTAEPTTTVTLESTRLITLTRIMTRVTTTSSSVTSSSSLTPAPITWSFPAVPPNNSVVLLVTSTLTPAPITWSFTALPPNPPSPDLRTPNSTASNSSVSQSARYYNSTSSYTGYNTPSAQYLKQMGNVTATSTAFLPVDSSNGMSGDNRVSFVALFFGLMVAAAIV
ncbi:hypothetical protein GMOD_00006838 [Pyrenophora seminiperda CCB06]|uniref:Uncharacterized protein n=1 Tax=Pyrenophora seminiperda CCB06 TaxID=1302712 RepID=A0A3M7MB00_9PLEO|nr:hypothetical protein GMOD_00006838 [Pyrenophora seminiperda CCB06]